MSLEQLPGGHSHTVTIDGAQPVDLGAIRDRENTAEPVHITIESFIATVIRLQQEEIQRQKASGESGSEYHRVAHFLEDHDLQALYERLRQPPEDGTIRLLLLDEGRRTAPSKYHLYGQKVGNLMVFATPDAEEQSWQKLLEKLDNKFAVINRQELFGISVSDRDGLSWIRKVELVTLGLPEASTTHDVVVLLTEPYSHSPEERKFFAHARSREGRDMRQRASYFKDDLVRSIGEASRVGHSPPSYNPPKGSEVRVPVKRIFAGIHYSAGDHNFPDSEPGLRNRYHYEVPASLGEGKKLVAHVHKRSEGDPKTWVAIFEDVPIVKVMVDGRQDQEYEDKSGRRHTKSLEYICFPQIYVPETEEYQRIRERISLLYEILSGRRKHIMEQGEFRQLRREMRRQFPRRVAKRMALVERERKDREGLGSRLSKEELEKELSRLQEYGRQLDEARRAEKERLTQQAIPPYQQQFEKRIADWRAQGVEVIER